MQLEVAVSCSSPFLYSPIGKIAKSCARTARRAERKHWRGELASPPLGLSIESALGGFFEDEIFLLTADQARDRRVTRQLRALGWSVCPIWECRLKQQPEVSVRRILRMLG
jgi:hypothetical protein